MAIIDIHTHLPTTAELHDPRDVRMVESKGLPLGAERQIDALLDGLERGGIDRAVVLGTPHLEDEPYDNDGLATDLKPHADRLIGFGFVDPRIEQDHRAAVRHCVEDLGLQGIGEFGGFDISDPMCFPIYEACIELDIPILIHLGIGLPSMPLRHCHPNLLDDVVIRYPDLKVIAAHCGAPWFNELSAVAYRHDNVWVDVSALGAYPKAMRYQAIGTMIAAGVGSRLMFGSDFPLVSPGDWATFMKGFSLPLPMRALLGMPAFGPDEREAMLHLNARKLLKLWQPFD